MTMMDLYLDDVLADPQFNVHMLVFRRGVATENYLQVNI